jgi:hypothetical protein
MRRRFLYIAAVLAFLPVPSGCAHPVVQPAALGGPARPPDDLLYVIPPGTAQAQMRGEEAYTIPPEIALVAGQAIAVRNEDSAMHYFFSMPIAPGQTVRKVFPQPGDFGYSTILSCSIARTETLAIHVAKP